MVLRGCVLFLAAAAAQAQWFAGAGGGISTLSADGQTRIDNAATAISLYKPENGPSAHVFAGRHLNNYVSLQGSYTWNRNTLSLTGSRLSIGTEATFQQNYTARSNTAGAEALLYFRPRSSRFRPYLSGGPGIARLDAKAGAVTITKGPVQLPPPRFEQTNLLWRTTVGIDMKLTQSVGFRYNFWETISSNPISKQLPPPGQRGLANFQSIFSIWKQF